MMTTTTASARYPALGVLPLFAGVVVFAFLLAAPLHSQQENPYPVTTMDNLAGGLKALWMDIEVEQVDFLTLGKGRASFQRHRMPTRWVPSDLRRLADGNRITYLVDQGDAAGSGLGAGAETAIDRAMASWSSQTCFSNRVAVVKRPYNGEDPDIFDAFLGFGGLGNYQLADIVHAGWMPPAFFDAVGGPGSGETVIAFSVTFVFVGADGNPTDVDGNGYLDTAASEIYYNSGFSWLLEANGGIDLESVALHELGHSLGIAHLEKPAGAVMNPVYSGPHRSLEPVDGGTLCSIWASWPK